MKKVIKKKYVLKAEVKDKLLGMTFILVPAVLWFTLILITR